MLDKLFEIKNYARFNNVVLPNKGALKRVNLIYAPNGTGKTSLSLIFQSLSTRDKFLIQKKSSIITEGKPEIGLILNGKPERFINGKWQNDSEVHKEIKVFNSYFLNNNVYTFNLNDKNFSIEDFLQREVLGKYEEILYNKEMTKEEESLKRRIRHNLRGRLRKRTKSRGRVFEEEIIKNKRYNKLTNEIRSIEERERELDAQIDQLIQGAVPRFIQETNNILSRFTKNIMITDLKLVSSVRSKLKQIVFSIKVLGIEKPLKREDIGFDYTLSDGDKSALALSSFFARINLSKNLQNQIVIIDDPFTSFDSGRKAMTIEEITRLTAKVEQIILLTHDKNFLFDFSTKVKGIVENNNINWWQLVPRGKFVAFEELHQSDNKSLIDRTIKRLRSFVENGESDQNQLFLIARSLRPLLEEIFRIKYSEFYKDNVWLSTYLEYIKKSENDNEYERFKRLIPKKAEIIAILDYTKKFNHAGLSEIDAIELEEFVKQTLEVFECI